MHSTDARLLDSVTNTDRLQNRQNGENSPDLELVSGQAYLETHINQAQTREPYERFPTFNDLIDVTVALEAEIDDGDLSVTVRLPSGDYISITTPASRFLYQMDRAAYIEALNAARSASATPQGTGA